MSDKENISEFVSRVGIKKTDLAEALGIDRQSLRRLERAKTSDHKVVLSGDQVELVRCEKVIHSGILEIQGQE